MSDFKREERYTVIKHNQLTGKQMQYLKDCIFGEGIPTVECVVIESDWPEYDPVWGMLKIRFEKEQMDEEEDCLVKTICDNFRKEQTK